MIGIPRAVVLGWTGDLADGNVTDFRAYCEDRRVMRRFSRRLGVKFFANRSPRVYEMHVPKPDGGLLNVFQEWMQQP